MFSFMGLESKTALAVRDLFRTSAPIRSNLLGKTHAFVFALDLGAGRQAFF